MMDGKYSPRSPGELRQMALESRDPVIREALAKLADFVENADEEEGDFPCRKEGVPGWSAKH